MRFMFLDEFQHSCLLLFFLSRSPRLSILSHDSFGLKLMVQLVWIQLGFSAVVCVVVMPLSFALFLNSFAQSSWYFGFSITWLFGSAAAVRFCVPRSRGCLDCINSFRLTHQIPVMTWPQDFRSFLSVSLNSAISDRHNSYTAKTKTIKQKRLTAFFPSRTYISLLLAHRVRLLFAIFVTINTFRCTLSYFIYWLQTLY